VQDLFAACAILDLARDNALGLSVSI
jgi:hypothetical protein